MPRAVEQAYLPTPIYNKNKIMSRVIKIMIESPLMILLLRKIYRTCVVSAENQ